MAKISKLNFLTLILSSVISFPVLAKDTKDKLSEKELVKTVISQNLELKTYSNQIDIAQAELIQAGKVNNLNAVVETQSLNLANLSKNDNTQFSIGVSYEFLIGNQLELRRNIANFAIEQAKLEFQNKIKEKVFNAVQSYNELLFRYKILELRKRHVDHTFNIYQAINNQYKSGEVAKYEVSRSELERNYADKSLLTAKKDIEIESANVNSFLNNNPENIIIPDASFKVPESSSKLATLIDRGLSQNIELKSLETQIKMEELRMQIAKLNIFPSLNTEILAGNQGVNAKVEFPIPFLYRQEGEIAISQANNNYILQRYNTRKQMLTLEINKAYKQLTLSIEVVKDYEKNILLQSKELQELAIKRLQAGEGSTLEVLEAEHTQIQNEDEYARLILEARKNYNYLEYVTGGNFLDERI